MVFGPVVLSVAGVIDAAATQQLGKELLNTRARFPKLKPGDIGKAAAQIQALQQQGLSPFAVTDPSTGNLVVGSRDQPLGTLVEEANLRRSLAPSPADLRDLERLRNQVIVARQGQPIFNEQQATVVPPLQFATAKLAPGGGVSSRRAIDSRLSGPCADARTGAARLRCGRGGFT